MFLCSIERKLNRRNITNTKAADFRMRNVYSIIYIYLYKMYTYIKAFEMQIYAIIMSHIIYKFRRNKFRHFEETYILTSG